MATVLRDNEIPKSTKPVAPRRLGFLRRRPRIDFPTYAPPPPSRPRLGFIMSGQGAHTAVQAGFMAHLLPHQKFADIDVAFLIGVSGGALNSSIAGRALNSSDDAFKARLLAASNLESFWHETTVERFWGRAVNDFLRATFSTFDCLNLAGSPFMRKRYDVSAHNYMRRMIEKHLPDDSGLRWDNTDVIVGTASLDDDGMVHGHSHRNGDISVNTLLGSTAVRNYFPAVQLPDGRMHFDGAYSGNPILDPLEQLAPQVDAIVWVHCNKGMSSLKPEQGLHLCESWEGIEKFDRLLPRSMPRYHVTFDFNLMYHTRLFPTSAQSMMLWQKGMEKAETFLDHHVPDIVAASRRPCIL